MVKKDKIVKIQYDFIRVRHQEIICLTAFLVSIFMGIASLILCWTIKGATIISLVSILILFAVSVIPLLEYLKIRSTRKRDYADAKYIMKHGDRVIGVIKSLKVIKMDEQFTYNIEYESPEKEEVVTMTTPTVVSDRMNITEKDLPLDVIVYVMGKRAYAYAVINPPLVKMKVRWMKEYFWVIVFVISIAAGILLNYEGHYMVGEVIILYSIILGMIIFRRRTSK